MTSRRADSNTHFSTEYFARLPRRTNTRGILAALARRHRRPPVGPSGEPNKTTLVRNGQVNTWGCGHGSVMPRPFESLRTSLKASNQQLGAGAVVPARASPTGRRQAHRAGLAVLATTISQPSVCQKVRLQTRARQPFSVAEAARSQRPWRGRGLARADLSPP